MWSPLHKLCARNADISEIRTQALLDGLDSKSPCGSTPLHFACLSDNLKAAKLFVFCGAPINIKNHNGETPLHFACRLGSVKLINLLLNNGADPTVVDNGKSLSFCDTSKL
jgi:ankyrin repeat protein